MVGIIRFLFLPTILAGAFLVLDCGQSFAENERYKAFPIIGGGSVFIIDTKEGHIWTWSNTGSSDVSSSGKNRNVLYQGNVRKNMNPQNQKIQTPEITTILPGRS